MSGLGNTLKLSSTLLNQSLCLEFKSGDSAPL